MSYEIYKIIHIFGVIAVFMSLASMALHTMNGGTKENNRYRKLLAAVHGTGLLVIMIGGMGLGARLGALQGGFAPWIHVKIAIWVVVGPLMMIPYRFPQFALGLWIGVPCLGALATWVVQYKTLFL